MCLAVPGKILEIIGEEPFPRGRVSFGGVCREVCLAYVPEAQPGDYVLVHVGFALSLINEQEAEKVFAYLDEMGQMEETEEKPV